MPRELISREVEYDRAPGAPTVGGKPHWLEKREYDLSVAWGRLPENSGLSVPDSVQVTVREAVYGPPTEKFPDGNPIEGSERYSSALSRKQINRLIQALRRARDQVFGRETSLYTLDPVRPEYTDVEMGVAIFEHENVTYGVHLKVAVDGSRVELTPVAYRKEPGGYGRADVIPGWLDLMERLGVDE